MNSVLITDADSITTDQQKRRRERWVGVSFKF